MKRIVIILALLVLGTSAIILWHRHVQEQCVTLQSGTPVTALSSSNSAVHSDMTQPSYNSTKDITQVSTQLVNATSAFDAALNSTLTTLQPGLTNISEKEIAQIYSGLKDPTDIVDVIDSYMRAGTRDKRSIARMFFEYMLSNYPEERLQACAHQRLGLLWSRDALYDGTYDAAAFEQSVQHSQAVINLPSKKYWYFLALDDLGTHYMIAGNMTGNYYEYHGKALNYFQRLYQEGDKTFMRENALCFMLRCLNSKKEKMVFYAKHKDEFTTSGFKTDFEEQATYQDLR